MMRKICFIGFFVGFILTGCASSPLDLVTGAIGSKPEISAQAGAENTKQTLGLNNKVDASSEVSNELKNSKVDNLDTSTGKKVSASSISADTITADKIEIRNSDQTSTAILVGGLLVILLIIAGMIWIVMRKAKGP